VRIPVLLVTQSRIPRWFGHEALTIWPVILVDGDGLSPRGWAHEYAHVLQQVVVAAVALVVIALTAGWSWRLFAAHPLPFGALYGLAWFGAGFRYDRNPFERHAEWYEGAHWREFT
jgi:hypothetical protein